MTNTVTEEMPSGFQCYQSPPHLVVLQTLPTALTSNFCTINAICILISGLGGIQINPLYTPTCLFHHTEDTRSALLSSTSALWDTGLTSPSPAGLCFLGKLEGDNYHRVAILWWGATKKSVCEAAHSHHTGLVTNPSQHRVCKMQNVMVSHVNLATSHTA